MQYASVLGVKILGVDGALRTYRTRYNTPSNPLLHTATMRTIALAPVENPKPGEVYYPLTTLTLPIPVPAPGQVQLRLLAASLNHRDLFQRQHLYPGTTPSIPLLADGVGIVTAPKSSELFGKRVLINPGRGWVSDPLGPAPGEKLALLGGTRHYPNGTLQEFGVFDEEECVPAPEGLSDEEAAALPVCGLTAWRAVVGKGRVEAGMNVLVTGIGGGAALATLGFCTALGAKVWVSSSKREKVAKAVGLGAEGGVVYSAENWEVELQGLLPKERPWLDLVVDGAGGDIVQRVTKLLREGGRVVSYGMTTGPKIPYTMQAVLRNVEVLGSTLGSRREFREMVEFVKKSGVRPVISKVVEGLDLEVLEALWEELKEGKQFGKLVVRIAREGEGERGRL
jgi:NADPH:quinone reductase-like Zn-dependent oxidoreductase